jgi:hypothetical protein
MRATTTAAAIAATAAAAAATAAAVTFTAWPTFLMVGLVVVSMGGSVGGASTGGSTTLVVIAWGRGRLTDANTAAQQRVHLLAAAIKLRVGGQGGLGMVRLLMDVFIVAQIDVLLAGHFSVQLPTHVGDVNSQNQNKSR